jgi:hypothetical protein
VIGGGPAIVCTWAGGRAFSPLLSVLFLSIWAGAVFEVTWEIVKLIRQDANSARMPLTIAGGAVAGMSLLYVTGLLIKQAASLRTVSVRERASPSTDTMAELTRS